MKTCFRSCFSLAIAVLFLVAQAEANVLLYDQNFENPVGFVNDGNDINVFKNVNQLYGNQPPGFTFAQTFTVETLLLTGNLAFGTGYSDPQQIGGNHSLGMLSSVQDDLLGLSFNMQGQNFLNFRLNISSIDVDGFGGPFNSPGNIPVFEITLFDNPSGATGLSGNGRVLDVVQITGVASSARNVLNWTEHNFPLSGIGSTNGNVTIRIDSLNTLGGQYAALDNFRIIASNVAVPEPSALMLLVSTAGVLAARCRRGRLGRRQLS